MQRLEVAAELAVLQQVTPLRRTHRDQTELRLETAAHLRYRQALIEVAQIVVVAVQTAVLRKAIRFVICCGENELGMSRELGVMSRSKEMNMIKELILRTFTKESVQLATKVIEAVR